MIKFPWKNKKLQKYLRNLVKNVEKITKMLSTQGTFSA